VEVEDRLAAARTDVHEHAVVLETDLARSLRDEVEHPLGLLGRERADVPERVDVALRQNEEMRLGLGVDVADGNEAVGLRDVVAFAREAAEEAILRQRGSPPP
jgi:hypothetical protein